MNNASYPSAYDKAVAYRMALDVIRSRHPEISPAKRMDAAWAIAEAIHSNQVEPLLINLAAINQALTIAGLPEIATTPEHLDFIDQVAARMDGIDVVELGFDEMADLHTLLNALGIAMSDPDGEVLSLSSRFKLVANELVRWRDATLIDIASGTNASPVHIDETLVMQVADTLPMLLGATKQMPVPDISPIISKILERLEDGNKAQVGLSSEVSSLRKTLANRLRDDQALSRRVSQRLERLERGIAEIEASLRSSQRNQTQQSGADRRKIDELTAKLDQMAAAISVANERQSRQLIMDALDSTAGQDVVNEFDREFGGSSSAPAGGQSPAKPSELISTDDFSGPLRARFDRLKDAMLEPKRAVGVIELAPKASQATPSPQPVTQPSARQQATKQTMPVGVKFALAVGILLAVVFAAGAILSNISFAYASNKDGTTPLRDFQEKFLDVTYHLHARNPDTVPDMSSRGLKLFSADMNKIYEADAQRALEDWLESPVPTSKAMDAATVALEKAGGFKFSKSFDLDPAYGIKKDGARTAAWKTFEGMLATETDRMKHKEAPEASLAVLRLNDWMRGYSLPSDRYFDLDFEFPTAEQQYGPVYKPALTDPPGPAKNCLLPRSVLSLKGQVPDDIVKAHTCAPSI